jgi:hypothetical protein
MHVVLELLLAGLILCTWSLLVKESFWFRISEHVVIGMYMAYTLITYGTTINLRVTTPLFVQGNYTSIGIWLVLILGIFYLIRVTPQARWLSRYSMVVLAGIGMAVSVRTMAYAQIIRLANVGSFLDARIQAPAPLPYGFNNFVVAVLTFTVLCYFLFTHRHTGLLGVAAKIGRHGIMISFGMTMGTYLLTNLGFAVGTTYELVQKPKIYMIPVAFVVLIISLAWERIRGVASSG